MNYTWILRNFNSLRLCLPYTFTTPEALSLPYCDNFDSLAAFIKTGKLPIVKKIGELTDDQLDNNWTEDKVLKLYAKAQSAEIEASRLTGRKAAQKQYEADTLWQRAATRASSRSLRTEQRTSCSAVRLSS